MLVIKNILFGNKKLFFILFDQSINHFSNNLFSFSHYSSCPFPGKREFLEKKGKNQQITTHHRFHDHFLLFFHSFNYKFISNRINWLSPHMRVRGLFDRFFKILNNIYYIKYYHYIYIYNYGQSN